jgi:hypothetical protein
VGTTYRTVFLRGPCQRCPWALAGPSLTSIEPARASHVKTRDRLHCSLLPSLLLCLCLSAKSASTIPIQTSSQVADLATAAAAVAAASTGVEEPVQSFLRQRSRSRPTLVEPPSSPDLDLERKFRARYCRVSVISGCPVPVVPGPLPDYLVFVHRDPRRGQGFQIRKASPVRSKPLNSKLTL